MISIHDQIEENASQQIQSNKDGDMPQLQQNLMVNRIQLESEKMTNFHHQSAAMSQGSQDGHNAIQIQPSVGGGIDLQTPEANKPLDLRAEADRTQKVPQLVQTQSVIQNGEDLIEQKQLESEEMENGKQLAEAKQAANLPVAELNIEQILEQNEVKI